MNMCAFIACARVRCLLNPVLDNWHVLMDCFKYYWLYDWQLAGQGFSNHQMVIKPNTNF